MKSLAKVTIWMVLTAATSLAGQWVGWITDDKCAAAGKYAGKHEMCLQNGGHVVFVNDADKKVYKLTNEDKAKELLGRKVSLTGTEKDDAIEVENVTENAS